MAANLVPATPYLRMSTETSNTLVEVRSRFRPAGVPGIRFGNTLRIVAKAETTGYSPAFHHACDLPQRCRLRSVV